MGNFAGGPGGFGGRGGRGGANGAGGGFVSGQVVSKDATSFTVSLNNNAGSKIVFFSTSTRVGETTNGNVEDIVAGKDVMVTGSTNADGSVTANLVQIRPAMTSSTMPMMQGQGR